MNTYSLTQYYLHYKHDLNQFVYDCEKLQEPYTWKISNENIASLKYFFTPNPKTLLAARLDNIVQNLLEDSSEDLNKTYKNFLSLLLKLLFLQLSRKRKRKLEK